MIRSSSAYSICTNRPEFNEDEYYAELSKLKAATAKNKISFNIKSLDKYCETDGIKTQAKKVKALVNKKYLAENDPLPDGAKTYIEERWLELNYDFYDFSVSDGMSQIMKGNICEEPAIDLLSKYYNYKFKKNSERKTFDFIAGECDLHIPERSTIRDVKVPETWKTFRKVQGIPLNYHWQLVAYCYLYGCSNAYLDYVLMPIPEEMIESFTRNFSDRELEKFLKEQEQIKTLALKDRIKTFKVTKDIQADIIFLESRLKKAKEYYDSLTYRKCMKFPDYEY